MGPDTLASLVELPPELTGDGRAQLLLTYQDRSGAILHQADFTGVLRRGLAYDGSFLWSCGEDADGGVIYEIDPDTCKVDRFFPTPGHAPSGVCWDGEHIWFADRDSRRIYRLEVDSGKVLRSAFAPGFSPFGLAWDGNHMWVTDSGTGRLYRLTGSRGRWTATVSIESFFFRGTDVLLLHDGISLWVLPDERPAAIRVRFD
jgi:streptogramin lyase